MLIAKRFTFEAAHQLPNHDGKCRRPHGHSYTVEVGVRGQVRAADGSATEGMVVDFGLISDVYKERIHDVCDHQDLNEALPVPVTTAELIAEWILEEMIEGMAEAAPGADVEFVRVWETATSYAVAEAVSED